MLKKMLALVTFAALMCGATYVGYAQDDDESADNEVQVHAYVTAPLRIVRLADLDLGTVRRNETKTITADGAGAAEIEVSGDADEDIQLTYPQVPAMVTLSHTDDDDGATLDVQLTCKTSYTQGSGGSNYNSGTSVELGGDGGGNGTMDGDGQRYFRFGGSTSADVDQARGHYSGSFMVSADYYP